MPTEEELLKVAEQSVAMAGSFIRLMSLSKLQIFQRKKATIYNKIVTNFDLASERLIKREIEMNFPDHEIHAEESEMELEIDTGKHEYQWFVDPLDGTKAFIKGNLAFVSLSVACCDSEGVVVAAIYNPFTDILYSASRSGKALMNGLPLPQPRAFLLSRSRIIIDFSGEIKDKIKQKLALAEHKGFIGRMFRYDGSIAQHLCLIAQGTIDGAIFYGSGEKGAYWDIAAGILILEKQDIKITDFNGDTITHKSKIFDQLIIAPPKIHTQLLKWVRSLS